MNDAYVSSATANPARSHRAQTRCIHARSRDVRVSLSQAQLKRNT